MSDGEQREDVGVVRAPLNKVWTLKIVVIMAVLMVFGGWGLYDATTLYPNRGAAYASYCQWDYLRKLDEADKGEEVGIFSNKASVPDPVAELARLTDPETFNRLNQSASDPASSSTLRASARLNRMKWLKGLKTLGALLPENTVIEQPRAKLGELSQHWATQEVPKALASYDIPVQWLIVLGAWAGALWMMLLMLKTMACKYTWDAAEQRLTVGRGSFVPGDLADFDKRKWDKFIVFLRLNDGHELGTGELKFDTYRHAKLEDWLLEMQEARFGPQEDGESSGDDQETSSESSEASATEEAEDKS